MTFGLKITEASKIFQENVNVHHYLAMVVGLAVFEYLVQLHKLVDLIPDSLVPVDVTFVCESLESPDLGRHFMPRRRARLSLSGFGASLWRSRVIFGVGRR